MAVSSASAEVSFNKEIRPILSDACFHCHGPDKAKQYPKSEPLALDTFAAATADRGGYAAIVPGKPEKSELYIRITETDPDEVMPPKDSHRTVTEEQKELLRKWIAEGAKYEQHWAFVPPVKAPAPEVKRKEWGSNAIDPFVLRKLEAEGMSPNSEASKETLIRRATLTLTGLPPTPSEVDAFLSDSSPNAYSKVLDRLLSSPRYGERMAFFWLEAARYADTDGYQTDGERTMWPWRDWVIKAFNDNLPFDEFSIKQLAGDMLPGDDIQNVLASAFNRNHRLNNEGGALPEEFIVEYAADRVETTGTVWMGLTAGCARCHDHKYDPFSQKEYFQLFAYFNSISERGKAAGKSAPPQIKIGSPLMGDNSEAVVAKRKELDAAKSAAVGGEGQAKWEADMLKKLSAGKASSWALAEIAQMKATKGGDLTKQADGSVLHSGANPNGNVYAVELVPPPGMTELASIRLDALHDPSHTKAIGFARSVNGNFVLSNVKVSMRDASGKLVALTLGKASHNYSQDGFSAANLIDGNLGTGWAAAGREGTYSPLTAVLDLSRPVVVPKGGKVIVQLEHGTKYAGHNIGRFRLSLSSAASAEFANEPVPASLLAALSAKPAERTPDQAKVVADLYISENPKVKRLKQDLAQLEKQAQGQQVNVLVMKESPTPTPTYLLERGQYTSPDKSEVLTRGVPASLMSGDKPQPKDRLELARWLVSDKNPLGARVFVNRVWQHHFGVGIVETSDNFGLQGAAPSHPELLDWLAVDFMENGWDMKRLHKMILSSATWKQSSKADPSLYKSDPQNRLLARGPRFRLDASAIRDSALYASGLMNGILGGPPVKPHQPDGLWGTVAGGAGVRYKASTGQDLYRRGLYTYWKRAVNPPRMLIFDAATREYCSVLRNATNTPLQALVLMNDVTFLESAKALAERMMKEGGADLDARLEYGFRLACGIKPSATELGIMRATYKDFKAMYAKQPQGAADLLMQGTSQRDASLDTIEHAALMAAAHLALNLDRSITLE